MAWEEICDHRNRRGAQIYFSKVPGWKGTLTSEASEMLLGRNAKPVVKIVCVSDGRLAGIRLDDLGIALRTLPRCATRQFSATRMIKAFPEIIGRSFEAHLNDGVLWFDVDKPLEVTHD